MDPFFTDLGRNVRTRWKACDLNLASFPQIAQEALEKRSPARNVDLAALTKEFLLNDEQPFQTNSSFGQPELIVFDDPRFYIQILFWLEGTTDIHQHMFSGAFHVMEGSSIHSRFAFQDAEAVTPHLHVGKLRLLETRLLETGSTVPIVSGRSHIHSLFHLDTPSLSVVIRTHTDPGTGPQFTYLPPHLAVDPFHYDALTNRRKQLLDVLEQTGSPSYATLIKKMLGQLDFERGFFVLQNCMGGLRNLEQWDAVWKIFERKHGCLAEKVAPTLEEIIRRDRLVALRQSVTEVEHRFFLALLMNAPNRKVLFEIVAQRFSGPPVDTVMRWLDELLDSSPFGTMILDAEFTPRTELPFNEQATIFLTALRFWLEGSKGRLSSKSTNIPHDDLKQLKSACIESSLRVLVI